MSHLNRIGTMKKILALALAAVVMFASACNGDDSTPPTTGTITGTVNLAPGLPYNLTNARVAIYASIQDMIIDSFIQQTALTGNSPTWTFQMANVTPGTYYLDVCIATPQGLLCDYFTTTGAQPSPIQVAAGQSTNVTITYSP